MKRFQAFSLVLIAVAGLACEPRGAGRDEAPGGSAITREVEGSREVVGSLENLRNVVLISIDSLGARHTSAYGYARETTPNLDRVAAKGTLFVYAYSQQIHTLSSHLTMMTGLYPQAHGASEKRVASAGARTLAEILKEHAFTTAASATATRRASARCSRNSGSSGSMRIPS